MFAILLLAGFFSFVWSVSADLPDHIIINEIQIAGTTADDEFIELYNPTNQDVDLSSWSIQYKGGSGTKYYRKNFTNNSLIKSKSYFLVTHNAFTGSVIADMKHSSFALSATGGTIFLARVQNDLDKVTPEAVIIDEVGYGFTDKFESLPALKPEAGQSIERKNFIDFGNNHEDFNLPGLPSPQNSLYNIENEDEGGNEEIECSGNQSYVKINEIYPNTEEENEEFVEITNIGIGDQCVNISGWQILDDVGHSAKFPEDSILYPGKYSYLQKKLYLNNDSDTVYLLNKEDTDEDDALDYINYERGKRKYSYSFDGSSWRWTSIITRGAENKFDEDIEYPEGVIINEVFPNPLGDEEEKEYIELFNTSKDKIDISGWVLKDAAKSNKYIFSDKTFIKSRDFLVIYRKEFDFALNNSGDETLTLLSPNGKKSSSVSYDGAKEELSYNFDGKKWRWSKDITPGKKNKFNKLPKIEVDINDKVYIGVYADFEVKVNDPEKEKVKVTWDFGDGHKSYKKETRHKYEKKGKYKLSVKIFDGSEEVIREYKIEVKKFPYREVKIRALCPNPAGDDSENEWILVKNYSDDEINLKGWSVATGSEKLYNHPIYEDIKIKKGKTEKITRKDSNLTLNNKKSKVELRYPDGKEAYKVKYDKGDDNTAEEDEVYEKTDGGWRWVKTQTNADETQTNIDTTQAGAEEAEEEDFSEFLGGQSAVEDRSDKMKGLVNYGVEIKLVSYNVGNNPRVLGISTEKQENSIYQFAEAHPTDHYAVRFFKNIFEAINYLLNKLIGGF